MGCAILKAECYAPIRLDRHRIRATPVAGQPVKPKHWQGHFVWSVRSRQRRENLLQVLYQIGPDAAAVALFIQPPQTLVLDRFDHWPRLFVVYSETLRY